VPSLKIILLCILSAVAYGICHDQVTARVCVEYFTVGHASLFHTTSPTLLAFGWGTVATWWVGLILGLVAALVARAGRWPKLDATHLVRPIACLLIVMAVASLLAGITGYQLAKASNLVLPKPFGSRVPKDHHYAFFANSLAHLAAYGIGLLGGLILCVRVFAERRRMARTPKGTTNANRIAEHWGVAVCRWTARAVGIPLFGLLVVLILGDGVPNPLRASLQENLLVAVVVLVFLGLVLVWKWEGVGSLLILGSLVLFGIATDGFLLNIVVAPWLVTGLLYLVCWLGTKKPVCNHNAENRS
jgi:hypothetical protein